MRYLESKTVIYILFLIYIFPRLYEIFLVIAHDPV